MSQTITSPVHHIPLLAPAQAQKHIIVNEALEAIDVRLFLSLQTINATVLPEEPEEGLRIAVAETLPPEAAQDIVPLAGEIAYFARGSWHGLQPDAGWIAWDETEAELVVFDPLDGWQALNIFGEDGTAPQLGINTMADTTNRLAVKSDAVLLSHDDVTPGNGDVRINVNKSTADQVATLAFQTDYVTHAEFGTVGTNDTTLRVSADGSLFKTAISFDKETAEVIKPLRFRIEPQDQLDPIIRLSGAARDGSFDNDHGVGLYLTHDALWNRQFAFLDTHTLRGIRVQDTTLSGYDDGDRADLTLGTPTHGVHVNDFNLTMQFSVSNAGGDPTKTVCALLGASNQSGDLLQITPSVAAPSEHALRVTAEGTAYFELPPVLPSLSRLALPAPRKGSLAYIDDLTGGGAPAYADGTEWRRMSDGSIVS